MSGSKDFKSSSGCLSSYLFSKQETDTGTELYYKLEYIWYPMIQHFFLIIAIFYLLIRNKISVYNFFQYFSPVIFIIALLTPSHINFLFISTIRSQFKQNVTC